MNMTALAHEPARPISPVDSIVHDLRNPLSAIHGSAELLLNSELSTSQLQRLARNVYGASVRMQELLDEYLTRNSDKQTIGPSDIARVVAGAVQRVALLAEAQSVRVTQGVPPNVMIPMDRQRIQRVLINLFVNALDVMPNGGTIKIVVTRLAESVLIKVRDTGPGIAAEIRERLFEPFVTAGKPGGLGLGLALSRQAVLDHGGDMWVESSSQGACFTVRLPVNPR